MAEPEPELLSTQSSRFARLFEEMALGLPLPPDGQVVVALLVLHGDAGMRYALMPAEAHAWADLSPGVREDFAVRLMRKASEMGADATPDETPHA